MSTGDPFHIKAVMRTVAITNILIIATSSVDQVHERKTVVHLIRVRNGLINRKDNKCWIVICNNHLYHFTLRKSKSVSFTSINHYQNHSVWTDPDSSSCTCTGMLAWIQAWLRLLWVGMWQWWVGLANRKMTDRRLYPHGMEVRQSRKKILLWNGPQVPRNDTVCS